MTDMKPFLKELISTSGLSGYEKIIRDKIAKTWNPLVDELKISKVGSLHGLKKGPGNTTRPSIMIATHMDAIGLMVSKIEGEFLRFIPIGSIDPRILPGLGVSVHGKELLPGVIVQPPDHLLPADQRGKPIDMEYLLVDVGLEEKAVSELVQPGDLISFAQEPLELSDEILVGHSLDNRASIAALTSCLIELQHIEHSWDVWATATVQEETTTAGAITSTFEIHPDIAIAVDVTFATGPGVADHNAFPLGSGPALGWGPIFHPALYNRFKETAETLDIPYSKDVMPQLSWTDGDGIQIVAEGIPTMLLSIPLRYMHTPVEMISMRDIQRTGHLLAQFIANLEPKFIENITWED